MVLCFRLLRFFHLAASTGDVTLEQCFGMILPYDTVHQFRFVGILHLSISVLSNGIGMVFVKLNTPFEEQFEVDAHGMDAGLHHNKITLGQGLQLIGCEERSLHHLQGFRWIVLASGYRSGHNCAATQGFRQRIGRRAVWRKATEQRDLSIIHDNLTTLFTVVLFELGKGLDDWNDLQASGSGCAEHHFRGFDLRQRTEQNLIALLKIDSICKFINSYDYMAALTIAEEIDDFISNDDKMLINIAVERLKLNSKVVDKLLAQQKIDLIPVKSGNQRSLFEYALALEIKIKKGEYADFIRGLTPLTADLSELILKSQCNIDINDYCKVNRYGLRKFDTRKLNGTDIYETLQNEFDGNFKPNDVGTRQMVPLINKYSEDNVLKQKIKEIMDIEQAIRNLAAHEIVSVTEEWIKEKTGFSSKQIFELIKFLIVKAGVKVSKEDWESYDKMNEIIVSKVRGYETLHR